MSWARANRSGLIALAVVAPLLAAVLVPLRLAADGGPSAVEQVAAGSRGRLDGLSYSVIAADEYGRAKGLSLPRGTTLVAAVVEVRPTDDRPTAAVCSFALSSPGPEGRSTRSPRPDADTRAYGYGRGAGFSGSCEARPTGRYRAELVFLAPEGTAAGGGGAIDVTATVAGRPRLLRLLLPAPPAPTAAALPAR